MRKFLLILTLIAVAFAFIAPASHAGLQDMWAQVYSWEGKGGARGKMELTKQTTNITFMVLQRNSDTIETLYEYMGSTSLTNPVVDEDFESATKMKSAGLVSFRVDPGETGDQYVDLIVTDMDGGFTRFYEDFDKNQHTIIIDERSNIQHHGIIWYNTRSPTATTPNEGMVTSTGTSEVDSGATLLPDTLVERLVLEVVDVVTLVGNLDGMHVGTDSTGTNGDADGFLVSQDLDTAGFIANSLASTGTFLDDGTDYRQAGHTITGSNEGTISYTANSLTSTTNKRGYLHYFFTRMR